ncbi:MAG TPA: type II toxin-antitoxin system antitoxin SocA domain-containing protein [Longimicrobium sp.]|jgi:uncharacterized phage-associated protein
MSRKITADEVADYFIALAHQRSASVNNLKLQKLLYYAQAWHLALYNRPLFPEKFQAWISGPVIPSVYWRFKEFGICDIPPSPAVPALPPDAAAFLNEVAGEYLLLDEWELDGMTRRELPWLEARGGIDPADPCSTELSEEDMRAYFRRLADAA